LHRSADPAAALAAAEVVVVGGGNTFRLLHEVQRRGLLAPLRARIAAGASYLGWSAGANLACPTIRTTNDMPIVATEGLGALGLVPFQINPHYLEVRAEGFHGETREQRLAELLALDPTVTVVGLREGSALRVTAQRVELWGPHPARLFRAGAAPRELPPGALEGTLG
jgi:dipeptidase E